MVLDLNHLRDAAISKGFSARLSVPDTLTVELPDGLEVVVANTGDDQVVSLGQTSWHVHPPWVTDVGGNRMIELSCEEMLHAIAAGDVLVVEIWESGRVTDRWLQHRGAQLGVKHLQANEELRVRVAGAASL